MNDKEICEIIAKKMDFEYTLLKGSVCPKDPSGVMIDSMTDIFNPIKDTALCFRLMVSFDVLKIKLSHGDVVYFIEDSGLTFSQKEYGDQRAICLAIASQ
jgi:hypothetical protein